MAERAGTACVAPIITSTCVAHVNDDEEIVRRDNAEKEKKGSARLTFRLLKICPLI